MSTRQKILIFLTALAFIVVKLPLCCAEKIILKNGKVIKGKIVEEHDEYIKVDIKGIALTYYKDEIHEISKNDATQSEIQSNSSARFRLSSPNGWHKKVDIKTPRGAHILFLYNKFKDRKFPMIAVMKDEPYPDDKTAIDFALKNKKMFMQRPPTPNMSIQGPKQVTVKGRIAAQMIMKDASVNMYQEWYQFLEDNTIITFHYSDSLE
ncbi:MAG: hypothetical protein KJ711_08495, partial [Candidatus Omnitrophica bacterium]|nr:hypothetical protein [Candidatus Omnitrophota bacterium]